MDMEGKRMRFYLFQVLPSNVLPGHEPERKQTQFWSKHVTRGALLRFIFLTYKDIKLVISSEKMTQRDGTLSS